MTTETIPRDQQPSAPHAEGLDPAAQDPNTNNGAPDFNFKTGFTDPSIVPGFGEAPVPILPASEQQGATSTQPEEKSRWLVRAADRVANLADRFADNMDDRRTVRETASDVVESGRNKVEHGREIATKVGRGAVEQAKLAGESFKENGREFWDSAKKTNRELFGKARNFWKGRAERAEARKQDREAERDAGKGPLYERDYNKAWAEQNKREFKAARSKVWQGRREAVGRKAETTGRVAKKTGVVALKSAGVAVALPVAVTGAAAAVTGVGLYKVGKKGVEYGGKAVTVTGDKTRQGVDAYHGMRGSRHEKLAAKHGAKIRGQAQAPQEAPSQPVDEVSAATAAAFDKLHADTAAHFDELHARASAGFDQLHADNAAKFAQARTELGLDVPESGPQVPQQNSETKN